MNDELSKALNDVTIINNLIPEPTYKLYYDDNGKVITYSTDDRPGNFIIITKEQYKQARPDVLVKDNKLLYTHRQMHVSSLKKNKNKGRRTTKYDVNILSDVGPTVYWSEEIYEIK